MADLPTQIVLFAVAGAIGFVVDTGVLLLALHLGQGYFLGRAISFLAAVLVTWCINRHLTFKHVSSQEIGKEWWRYFAIASLAGFFNYAVYCVIVLTAPKLDLLPVIAVAGGSLAGMSINFIGAKWWVFRPHPRAVAKMQAADVQQTRKPGLLGRPQAPLVAAITVPFFFGFYSLFLGADANWDLYNYHLYAPFALLHSKLSIDLAPAGFQGYFNPILDVPIYLMNRTLPSALSGFLQGMIHGTAFIVVMGIADAALPERAVEDRYRIPILLAVSGCLTAVFLSELGNSMGDNTTALFVLGSIYIIVSRWQALSQNNAGAIKLLSVAGLLAGLAMGLKLTNAVPAFSICLALLVSCGGTMSQRIRRPLVFGLAALVGFGVTGGYWMLRLWQEYGNPLFPQFSSVFPNPMVVHLTVADMRWVPKGFFESIFWPFIFSLNPHRVGELSVKQAIWPIVYVTFWIWIARRMLRIRWHSLAMPELRPEAAFLLFFIAASYLLWMKLFSISRYMVSFEILLPVAFLILLMQLRPYKQARRTAAWLLVSAASVVLVGGARTWGHEGWGDPLYHAEVPSLPDPARATVLLASPKKPLGWLATLFPPEIVFIGIENSFPAAPAYAQKAQEIARSRGGEIFVITDGEDNKRASRMAFYDEMASRVGLTASQTGCDFLRSAITQFRFRADVAPSQSDNVKCSLDVQPSQKIDVEASDRARLERAGQIVARAGFTIRPDSCIAFTAGIGSGSQRYQLCVATLP